MWPGPPRLVPVGELLSLLGEDREAATGLLPEELAICRSLNLAPEEYLQAKEQTAQLISSHGEDEGPGGSRAAPTGPQRQKIQGLGRNCRKL